MLGESLFLSEGQDFFKAASTTANIMAQVLHRCDHLSIPASEARIE